MLLSRTPIFEPSHMTLSYILKAGSLAPSSHDDRSVVQASTGSTTINKIKESQFHRC